MAKPWRIFQAWQHRPVPLIVFIEMSPDEQGKGSFGFALLITALSFALAKCGHLYKPPVHDGVPGSCFLGLRARDLQCDHCITIEFYYQMASQGVFPISFYLSSPICPLSAMRN